MRRSRGRRFKPTNHSAPCKRRPLAPTRISPYAKRRQRLPAAHWPPPPAPAQLAQAFEYEYAGPGAAAAARSPRRPRQPRSAPPAPPPGPAALRSAPPAPLRSAPSRVRRSHGGVGEGQSRALGSAAALCPPEEAPPSFPLLLRGTPFTGCQKLKGESK
ncbi:vegetative cell wall protein gp1-like [Motacilla alba alba]|uniref:vegetative cell wall protein gp1-like n=1 Tax=Motacilla alba alba TaxID=1094192 RepID=UPI0018D4E5CB|nr:vegetative cell wall protein gp1-like [Motacilla alba alba]